VLSNKQNSFDLEVVAQRENQNAPVFMASNRLLPVKNVFDSTTVVVCTCELILLLAVMLYLVSVVHKFDL
jgi:hypothetical protein